MASGKCYGLRCGEAISIRVHHSLCPKSIDLISLYSKCASVNDREPIAYTDEVNKMRQTGQ